MDDENPSTPLFAKNNPPFPPPRPYSYSTRSSRSIPNEMISVVLEVPSQVKAESSYYQTSLMNDNYLILSIGLTLLSVCFGCFPALFFSIPAIVYSVKARKAYTLGNYDKMRAREKTAFALNIFVFLIWIISFTLVATVTYRVKCGVAGIKCNTSPYKINHE